MTFITIDNTQSYQIPEKSQNVYLLLSKKNIEKGNIAEYFFDALVNITYVNRNVIITTETSTLRKLYDYEDALERLFKLFQVSLNILPSKSDALDEYSAFILKLFIRYANDLGMSPETKFYPLSLFLRQRMLTTLKELSSGYHTMLDQIYYPYCHFGMDIIKPVLEQCRLFSRPCWSKTIHGIPF